MNYLNSAKSDQNDDKNESKGDSGVTQSCSHCSTAPDGESVTGSDQFRL